MLTNATVKAARAAARPYKLADGGGLFLHVLPTGQRAWRMRCWLSGREILLTFGRFPDISLGEARERRDQAREQLQLGVDPRLARASLDTVPELAADFEAVGRRWHEHMRPRWSELHAGDVLTCLERDVFPAIGAMPIGAITIPVVLSALRRIEARGAIETARRARQRISAVFSFAMSEGLVDQDPAAIVAKALGVAPARRRQPALLEIEPARELLAAAELVDAGAVIKLASRFLALTAVRLATLRGARWSEFEGGVWRIPAARMKLTRAKKADPTADHLVPLSSAAEQVLRDVFAITGGGEHVFPGRGGAAPIGERAIGDLYDRAGYRGRHVPHGWRATFSTVMNEARPEDRALIDLALGHAPKDKVEAAYNRAEHLARRRELFQRWADLLLPSPT